MSNIKNKTNLEYWYDKNHTGALRIVDYNKNLIFGGDPKELNWIVPFEKINSKNLRVDWHSKKTHHGKKIMISTYKNRRNTMAWPDGNEWKRMRVNPQIILSNRKKFSLKKKKKE